MSGRDDERPDAASRRDHVLTQVANGTFSIAQAMAAVVVPLLAVDAGHGIGTVGVLVAVSAVSQTAARFGIGQLMTRFPTRSFIVLATILLAASCVLLAMSAELWVFVVSQLLQGAARAYFWTGSQTHVVRGSDSAVVAMSRLNVVQGVGQLIGPVLAGILGALSLQIALIVAGALSAAALLPSCLLLRFPPFARSSRTRTGRDHFLWRRTGVATAASMSAAGGAWRGIVNSYLPVVLAAAGYGVFAVGALITVTNLAALGGSLASRCVRTIGGATSALAIAAAGLGLAGVGFFPALAVVVVIALAVSGFGAGILQTIGPALAAVSVSAEERGAAIATIGTFRSLALLVSPLATAGLVLLLPSAALASGVAGIIMAMPTLAAARRWGRRSGSESEDDHG
jgi:MFS family permease